MSTLTLNFANVESSISGSGRGIACSEFPPSPTGAGSGSTFLLQCDRTRSSPLAEFLNGLSSHFEAGLRLASRLFLKTDTSGTIAIGLSPPKLCTSRARPFKVDFGAAIFCFFAGRGPAVPGRSSISRTSCEVILNCWHCILGNLAGLDYR